MHLKTILYQVERHRGFVYEGARFAETGALEVAARERAAGRSARNAADVVQATIGYRPGTTRLCRCGPLAVFLVCPPRRVHCRHCGAKVERVPWADGKSQLTTSYRWFLASWAKLLTWQQVAKAFQTSWQTVYRAVEWAVAWGLAHRWRGSKRSASMRCNGEEAIVI